MKEFKVTFLKETWDLMDILVKFSYHPKILTQQAIWGTQTSILNKHHGNSDADVPWNNFSFSTLKSLYRRMSRAMTFSSPSSSTPFSHLCFPMKIGHSIWIDLCYLHVFPPNTNKNYIFSLMMFSLTYEQHMSKKLKAWVRL